MKFKINDKNLLKISLTTSCIGIFLLWVILISEKEQIYTIEETKELEDNTEVVVYASVESLYETDKVLSINIIEYKPIKQEALIFKDPPKKDKNQENKYPEINEGDMIIIKGSMYKGKIIANEIAKTEAIQRYQKK